MFTILKNIFGIIMLPFAVGFFMEFVGLFIGIAFGAEISPFLIYGFGAYLVVHVFLFKPKFSYVFAHEFTHALWALPFGGKLKGFHVEEDSGHVLLSKSNVWISLAPYFFPLYAYGFLGLYGILVYLGVADRALDIVAFLVGFSISFHVLFTIHSLLRKQTDLDGPGVLPSLVLILVCNTCFLVLAFQILAPEQIEVLEFFSNSIDNSVAILVSIINYFQ